MNLIVEAGAKKSSADTRTANSQVFGNGMSTLPLKKGSLNLKRTRKSQEFFCKNIYLYIIDVTNNEKGSNFLPFRFAGQTALLIPQVGAVC